MYAFQARIKEYWGRLDISVEDALEFEQPKKKPWLILFNKMKKMKGWLEIIDIPKRKKDHKTYFKHLFKNEKRTFYKLYFLCEFASNVDNVAIKERLSDEIKTKYQTKLDNGEFSYESMLYPIYKTNPNLLESILNDSKINKSSMKAYEFTDKDITKFVKKLNETSINDYFDFLKDKGKLRSNYQIWWFERRNGKIKILVRTESKHRSSIHQVTQNTFLKTAGDRIMVFYEDGKRLEILSKDAPRVSNWANQIASKEMGFDIKFKPVPEQFDSKKIMDFILEVKDKKIPNISLSNIEVTNVPLADSPTITLDSSLDSISDSINELKDQHNLELLNSIENVNFVTFVIDDISYKILLKTENNITEISFDNRNIHEKDKNKFYEVLNLHIE